MGLARPSARRARMTKSVEVSMVSMISDKGGSCDRSGHQLHDLCTSYLPLNGGKGPEIPRSYLLERCYETTARRAISVISFVYITASCEMADDQQISAACAQTCRHRIRRNRSWSSESLIGLSDVSKPFPLGYVELVNTEH